MRMGPHQLSILVQIQEFLHVLIVDNLGRRAR